MAPDLDGDRLRFGFGDDVATHRHLLLAFVRLGDARWVTFGLDAYLMDWEKLQAWKQGARTACTLFCMGYQDLVHRIAIIGAGKWKDEGERLTDVYKNAQVHFFPPSGREAAMAWLEGL